MENKTNKQTQPQNPNRRRWWTRGLLALALLLGALVLPTNPVYAIRAPSAGTTVSVDRNHGCVVTSSGGLVCWGNNEYGGFGDPSLAYGYYTPRVIPGVSGIKAVAVGYDLTCILDNGGGVKCTGRNGFGQLGDGTTTGRATFQYVNGLSSGVANIDASNGKVCVVTTSGGAKCWGVNQPTPMDVPGLTSGVAVISTVDVATCVITTSGAAKCWGDNTFGQLGDGTTTNRSTPVDVIGLDSGVTAIAVGALATCAVVNGGVKCWGYGLQGQVGDGTQTNRSVPTDVLGLSNGVVDVSMGTSAACAILATGHAKCWGSGASGYLGIGWEGYAIQPQDVLMLTDGLEIDGGVDSRCALGRSGDIWCWGKDRNLHVPMKLSDISDGALVSTPLQANKSNPVPYPPVAGQPVSYSIVVTNTGTMSMTNVAVTNVPGPGLGTMTAFTSSPAGSCNTTTHVCTLSSALAPGAVATFNATFATPPTAGVVITNTAYVNATEWQPNVYPDNDSIAALTVADSATTNLAVTKTASTNTAVPGDTVEYMLTVTNNGGTAATNVEAVDTLPAGLTFVSASAMNGGSCSHAAGVVTCTWASLASAASTTATIAVTVNP
ncbi:MAG: DUF11 domain-containing protein [Caldilineaceae bacterium]|nr:DUF11 domain-containing protein [Caldilineaceae bacterium]